MQLLITRITDPDRPIQAIKAVRAVTGLGLREAKEVVDQVKAGSPCAVTVTRQDNDTFDILREHGILFTPVSTRDLAIRMLRQLPPHLTVAEVLSVADALDS